MGGAGERGTPGGCQSASAKCNPEKTCLPRRPHRVNGCYPALKPFTFDKIAESDGASYRLLPTAMKGRSEAALTTNDDRIMIPRADRTHGGKIDCIVGLLLRRIS